MSSQDETKYLHCSYVAFTNTHSYLEVSGLLTLTSTRNLYLYSWYYFWFLIFRAEIKSRINPTQLQQWAKTGNKMGQPNTVIWRPQQLLSVKGEQVTDYDYVLKYKNACWVSALLVPRIHFLPPCRTVHPAQQFLLSNNRSRRKDRGLLK